MRRGRRSAGEGEGAVEEQLAYFNSIVSQLLALVPSQPRSTEGSFLFAIDHCFAIKGQGTVLTGTVLKGKASVNDTIELAGLRLQKKIRTIQMFKQPAQHCQQVSSKHLSFRDQGLALAYAPYSLDGEEALVQPMQQEIMH